MPYYVQCYLGELVRFFDQVIVVTNSREYDKESYSAVDGIDLITVSNEGYDFGMFYKAIQLISIEEYETIACVNDSNLIVSRLDPIFSWGKTQNYGLWSLIDSYEKPWFSTHSDSYHLQSFFLVFEQPALKLLSCFFESIDDEAIFSITDPKELRRQVINDWEIGLTQFMISHGVKTGSFIDSKIFSEINELSKNKNLTIKYYELLLKKGYPLLKKSLLSKTTIWNRLAITPKDKWSKIINKYGSGEWNAEKMINQ
jgi:lipopolysaccharide biosynthesis protein